MGSGHILVYAFDVFMQLYEAEGQSPRTAAELILENNLFGLDIDQRAFQLAYFALMMKGRQYSRRILAKQLRPNVHVVPNNSEIGEAELQLVQMQFNDQKKAQQDLLTLVEGFKNGAELGSLIKFEGLDFENLKSGLNNTNISFYDQSIKEMIVFGELLQQQYEIGITNPPYMGSSGMDKTLSGYVKKIYPDSKSDLFGVFIERLEEMIKSTGYYAMITQHAWMFLSSFEKLRIKINQRTIINMAHLGTRAFEEIGGEVVQTTAFVITPKKYKNYMGSYLRLVDFDNYKLKEIKTLDAITDTPVNYLYRANQGNFLKIPGQPISYWINENIVHDFVLGKQLGEVSEVKKGMFTGQNDLFFRTWTEPAFDKIQFNIQNRLDVKMNHYVPINKGGGFRRWYGNNEFIMKFDDVNYNIIEKNKGHRSPNYYFKPCIEWTKISSGKLALRYSEGGFVNNDASMFIYSEDHTLLMLILGIASTKVSQLCVSALNESMNYTAGDIARIPILVAKQKDILSNRVVNCVEVSKDDWDSFENSWNFKKHPLV